MIKKLSLFVGAAFLFLSTPNAWAVPVDSFDCTYSVRDSADKLISSHRMRFDVARKPKISTTGYQETEGDVVFETKLSDGLDFGVSFDYVHASNGVDGYQRLNHSFSMCEASSPTTKRACAISNELRVKPYPPNAGPYSGWRRVDVANGIPQFDPGELGPISWVINLGREFRIYLSCEYKGLTE